MSQFLNSMFAMYLSTGGTKENKQMNVQHQT